MWGPLNEAQNPALGLSHPWLKTSHGGAERVDSMRYRPHATFKGGMMSADIDTKREEYYYQSELDHSRQRITELEVAILNFCDWARNVSHKTFEAYKHEEITKLRKVVKHD